jgi:hypothetical protein
LEKGFCLILDAGILLLKKSRKPSDGSKELSIVGIEDLE